MENNFNDVLMVKKIKLPMGQMLVENGVVTLQDVSKILSVDANVSLKNDVVVVSSEANISGKLVLSIVYADAEGNINCENQVSNFTYKVNNENIDSQTKVVVNAVVLDNDVNLVGGKELKIVTTINFNIMLIKNYQKKCLVDCGENTYSKLSELSTMFYTKDYCERFEEALDVKLTGGVKKILNNSVELEVKDVVAGTNFVAVEGELFERILYISGEENGELRTITINKQFKQEFEMEGINRDSLFDFTPYISYDEISISIEDNDEETKIGVVVPMLMCFNFFDNSKVMCIEDLYSTKEIVEITKEIFECHKTILPFVIDGKIEGSVMLSDDNPRIDKYLCATNIHAVSTNTYIKDGLVNIEGIANANVLYLNDETGGIMSVAIEIPFVIASPTDLSENSELSSNLCLENADIAVKKGREIFFDAKIKALIGGCEELSFNAVVGAERIGEVEPKDASLEIYFAKMGESIWDIAKNLKIPSEIIINQNPNLSDPLEKDEKVAIYYQKTNK